MIRINPFHSHSFCARLVLFNSNKSLWRQSVALIRSSGSITSTNKFSWQDIPTSSFLGHKDESGIFFSSCAVSLRLPSSSTFSATAIVNPRNNRFFIGFGNGRGYSIERSCQLANRTASQRMMRRRMGCKPLVTVTHAISVDEKENVALHDNKKLMAEKGNAGNSAIDDQWHSTNTTHDNDDNKDEIKDINNVEEEEQEDMFVTPHESFEFTTMEWGGPRRGGRFPEPTRYGDWERKGRCTDF